MDLFEALQNRRSVRRFKPDPVPREDIRRIVAAATLAPNGSNAQPWRFIVLTDKAKIEGMRRIVDDRLASLTSTKPGSSSSQSNRNFINLFAWAPAVVCVFETPYDSHADKMLEEKAPEVLEDRRLVVNTALQSVSAAVTCLTLAAHALGYGTCWMTGPLLARKEIEKFLGSPQDNRLVAIVPLGVPEGSLPTVHRKPVDEVLEIK